MLPPANPKARGLRLTDDEFDRLTAWASAQLAIIERAWVWGSRRTGVRRHKEGAPRPADIDVAVQITSYVPAADRSWAMFELRWSLEELGFALNDVHVEYPFETEQVGEWFDQARATQIFP